MAKKKPPSPPDEGPKRRGRAQPKPKPEAERSGVPDAVAPVPEPKVSAKKSASKKRPAAEPPGPSPLERARELAAQAAEALEPRRRIALARKAIEVSPDCSEAYLLLADHAKTRKESISLYERAVDSAARELGPGLFRDGEGHFWHLLETRPYMTARLGLAEALWTAGSRAEAAEHLRDMLRLNPGDNQGLRYILSGWLLNLDRLEDLESLLDEYDEDSATWAYTRALIAFRVDRDTPASRKLLQAARRTNKHVPDYLLGRKPLPADQPGYYSPGDEDDAILYVANNLGAWKSSAGALAWLRSKVKDPRKRRPKVKPAVGPTLESVERLCSLPMDDDIWQADFRQFARRVDIGGERVRPWMVLVSSRTRDLVLAHALTEEAPSPEALWDIVAGAMERPAAGEPQRPVELQIRPGVPWDALETGFRMIDVNYAPSESLDQIDFLFDDLTRHMEGAEPPGLLNMPGVTPEQVGRFYEAAAEFYRRAPWRSLGFEAVIQVECDRYESGPWYAVIMGQSGLTLGVALYEDLTLLRRMWAGKLSEEEGARKTVALTVTYDDESSLSEADLESIEEHGYPIAAPEAFPSVFRKERGLSMRPPLGWEIDLMVACLATFPDFVARRAPDDPTRELVPGPGAANPIELGLSWIEEPM